MTSRRQLMRAACVAALGSPGVVASCTGNVKPAPGELMIAITTDMEPGKDFDTLYLDVLSGGQPRYTGFNLFPSKVGAGADALKMPTTIALVAGEDTATPAVVRIIATKGTKVRVLREATVTVPTDRVATIRMPVEWLCTGPDGPSVTTNEDPTRPPDVHQCDDGSTCVGGKCQKADFTDKALFPKSFPDFTPALVFGGQTKDDPGQCFDTLVCFASPTLAQPDADCTVPDPGGTPNVALLLGTRGDGSDGICGDAATSQCFVPLDGPDADSDNAFGAEAALIGNKPSTWTTDGRRITLPKTVCDRLALPEGGAGKIAGVVVSTSCATKTAGTPTCGPWSAVGGGALDAGTPPEVEASIPGPVLLEEESGKIYPGSVLGLSMAVAGERVYFWGAEWADGGVPSDDFLVESAPIAGGPATVSGSVAMTFVDRTAGPFTDGSSVFFPQLSDDGQGRGKLKLNEFPLGAALRVAANVEIEQPQLAAGFDGTSVYFITSDVDQTTETLFKLNKTGGDPVAVSTWSSFTRLDPGFSSFAVGPNAVYAFAAGSDSTDLVTIPFGSTSGPTVLFENLGIPPSMLMSRDGSTLYLSDGTVGTSDGGICGSGAPCRGIVNKIDLKTNQATALSNFPGILVSLDDEHLYSTTFQELWVTDFDGKSEVLVRRSETTPLTTTASPGAITGAVAAGDFIYYVTGDGKLSKVAKSYRAAEASR